MKLQKTYSASLTADLAAAELTRATPPARRYPPAYNADVSNEF